jgi:MFS transporter, DHA2 family, multidrug resistance protein
MMPIVGKLLQRGFPAQLMNAAGFVAFFIFTLMLSKSTLDSGQFDFFWPLVWRGVGLGLLFVPLTTLALGNLRGADIAQGAGMTNMMRQLGGSFGVALIATYIQQRSWTHRQNLLRHVSIYDPAVRERLDAITRGFLGRGSSLLTARRQAYGAIEGAVVRQTFLLTYMDAFRLVGIFFLICIPMLLLFKRRRSASITVSLH